MVGATGIEPVTPTMSTHLYAPFRDFPDFSVLFFFPFETKHLNSHFSCLAIRWASAEFLSRAYHMLTKVTPTAEKLTPTDLRQVL
jgi:hypothetical protein